MPGTSTVSLSVYIVLVDVYAIIDMSRYTPKGRPGGDHRQLAILSTPLTVGNPQRFRWCGHKFAGVSGPRAINNEILDRDEFRNGETNFGWFIILVHVVLRLSKELEDRINAFEAWTYRRMLGVSYRCRVGPKYR